MGCTFAPPNEQYEAAVVAWPSTAIGLKISIGKLFRTGRGALSFGIIIFAIQILIVLGLVRLLL